MNTQRGRGSTALLVLGAVAALLGLAALGGGGGLLVLQAVGEDADGFLTSGEADLATGTRALVSEDLDMWAGTGPSEWTPRLGDVALRVEATPTGDGEVFLGVGPSDEVDAYLDGVDHAVLTRVTATDTTMRQVPGDRVPAAPATMEGLWDATATGAGTQTLTWDAHQGSWTLVLMNADAAAGISVVASGGARVPYLTPIGVGLLVVGGLLLAAAVAMLVAGAATSGGTPRHVPPASDEPEGHAVAPRPVGPYPAALTATLDPSLSRWQWLVKWFLAIPHVVVLAFLWPAFLVLTVVAGIAILFTGRYPRSIFDLNVGIMRWTWRVTYYAFTVAGTDAYPPFTLQRTAYAADFDVAYPEQGLSRLLVLVKSWLLALPHWLVISILTGGVVSWTADVGGPDGWKAVAGGGLVGVLTLVAVVMLLFSGRYPHGLYDLTMGLQRWVYRVIAYVALMTDEYPPFRLDTGGSEPPNFTVDDEPTQPPGTPASLWGPEPKVPV